MQIAMVGAGGIAQRHLSGLVHESDITIVGHVAPRRESIDAAIQRWGGRGYQDINSLLESETVDAAWITVPPGEHGVIEFALLERNIPFFVEKPLSADRQTAEKIAEMIDQTGTIVGVGYHWRALDILAGVRAKLAENPARMVLGRWHDSTPPPLWWRHQATSGGQMVEQATHLVDLARYLLGEAQVTGSLAGTHHRPAYPDADVAGVSAALLQFPDNTVGVFSATCLLPSKDTVHLQFVCEGMLITIEQTRVVYDDGKEKRESRVGNDPFVTENRAFIRALQQKDPSLLYSTYADAMRTHRLCHNILEASQV
jgi:myo-inositol 2-dehydrogenase/D-chiro-inositol 1-dehydrogenase